jgi:penicillin-binding protein 1A
MAGAGRKRRRTERVEPRLVTDRRADRQPSRPRPAPPRRRRSLAGLLFRFGIVSALWGSLALALLFGYIWLTLSQNGVLRIPEREPGVMILADDGTRLAEQGAFRGDETRLGDLPDYVPNALIAIEDRRFRSHFGVDPIGLGRAVFTNLVSGRMVQGGSTLTQQLAKNLFLSPARTLERKLQEAVLAVWLETQFSKDEILQLYLNRVYFGQGATGIEKAAQTYYRKPAAELTLTEAATLAGLLPAPSAYNPMKNPEAAARRARLVLQSMAEEGFISATEAQLAIDAPAEVVASDYIPATQYVADWVREQLPDLVGTYDQSIVVETTIDPAMQAAAELALRKRLNDEGRKVKASEGALVMLDGLGAVKALVGGKSYRKSQFNRATKARRQPGSAFKPFVYLAAIEQGFGPDSVMVDEPVRIGNWQPENYRQNYLGPVTLETAFALSLNTIAAKLAAQVGPARVAAMAHRLGITSPLGTDASIALGTSEVTPLELTAAFVPFANGGYPVVPHVVSRISTRDGQVLYERRGDGFARALTDAELGALNRMMRAVVTEGTGKKAQFGNYDIGGKTGTSQDYRDAWFVGYTADYVVGVWVGNDDNAPTRKVTGGALPAEIWRDVMEQAMGGLSVRPLPGETIATDPDLTTISRVEAPSQQQVAEETMVVKPKRQGFFERLGNLFSGGSGRSREPRPWEGRKDSP